MICKFRQVTLFAGLLLSGLTTTFSGYCGNNESTRLALNPLCEEASHLTCEIAHDARKVFVSLDISNTGIEDKRLEADCYILTSEKFQLPPTVTLKFKQGKGTVSLPLPLPGEYTVVARLFLDGVEQFKRSVPLRVSSTATMSFDAMVKEKSKFNIEIDPDSYTVKVSIDLQKVKKQNTQWQGECGIVQKGKNRPEKPFHLNFANGNGSCIIPLPGTPGEYELLADIKAEEVPPFELRKKFTIPTTEWLGNTIGLEDKVLPPWTPIVLQGTAVKCWGREYLFGDGAFPLQIISANSPILSSPISFNAKISGKKVSLKLDRCKVDSVSGTRVVMLSHIFIQDKEFKVRVTTEYDGLALFEISSDKADTLLLDELNLEIPIKAEHALYRYIFNINTSDLPGGNIPSGNGIVEVKPWMPFVWLGDNDRGLFWFCESDNPRIWPNKDQNAIEIERAGKEVILRFNILAAGQKFPSPKWNMVFGLQATPVKKVDTRMARARRFYGPTQNIDWAWPDPKKDHSTLGMGYPEAANPQAYSDYVKGLQQKGRKVCPYLGLTFIADGLPESVFFKKYWFFGFDDPSISQAGWSHNWYCASPVGKGYADFVVWKTKTFLERYNLDGYYIDQAHPYVCDRESAGVGYEWKGKRYYTYPILGYRNLYRRMFSAAKALPRDTFTLAHMSAKMNISSMAYVDACLDGEWPFAPLVRHKSYMEVMTMDTFRAMFMGRQWGVAMIFLPELRGGREKLIEPTKELMGLLMIHDVAVMRLFCKRDVVDGAHRALDDFGYADADFIPYFDTVPPAVTDMKDVYVSAYKHDNGSVLLIAANLSKEKLDRTGKIRINAKRLGIKTDKLISWPDRTPIQTVNDEFELTVPKMDFRMFVIGTPVTPLPKTADIFSGWVISDMTLRKESAQHVKAEADKVTLTAKEKSFTYFSTKAIPVMNSDKVKISFKVSGKGSGNFGFFAYEGTGWKQANGSIIRPLPLKNEPETVSAVFPVNGNEIGSVRPVFTLGKESEMTVSNYKLTLEK